MKERISVAYGATSVDLDLPADSRVEFISPRTIPNDPDDETASKVVETPTAGNFIQNGLASTFDQENFDTLVIVVDDNTRVTPVRELLPPVLEFAGENDLETSILVAGGSHRKMTLDEKKEKFGSELLSMARFIDHEWENDNIFKDFGPMPGGYHLKLNKLACEPRAFLVAIGNIVPHSVAGFSGGYKILLPGLSCAETVRKIHFLVSKFRSEEILGTIENPIRRAIDEVHRYRPIDFLINTVLDGRGNMVSLCTGHPIRSQKQGASIARDVYGVPVGTPADVVIADSVPESIDFWVVAKAVTNTRAFVKPGGHLVVVGPCNEGLSPAHGEILQEIGYHEPDVIRRMVKQGEIPEEYLLEAAHACQVGEVMTHCKLHIVSDGLLDFGLERFGMDIVPTSEANGLIDRIITREKTLVKVVYRGSEILPITSTRVMNEVTGDLA